LSDGSCIFCRIVARQLPSTIVHDGGDLLAFRDIDPKAPTHILIVPRRHIQSVNELVEADAGMVGQMVLLAGSIAKREGIDATGYRLVMNTGAEAGQSVPHLHLHVLGGRGMRWPPG
jgi:histidine triad (HIT) family protein